MPNKVIKSVKAVAKVTMKVAKEFIGKEVVEKAVLVGTEAVEKYNSRIEIPDLKDVFVEDAVRNLNDLNLLPITAIAQPNVGYANTYENIVVSSDPKFGKKVDSKSTVKLYYVTNEVIVKSVEMEKSIDEEFKLPRLIGLDIYEAREDLEELGLRVTLKLENPNIQFINREEGQVTRAAYPDNKKLTPKQKKGERIWLYYVDDKVINESLSMKEIKLEKASVRKERISKVVKDIPNRMKRKKTDE